MDGFSGPFDESLSYKGRALPTPVHPGFLPTALRDRRDTAILLDLGGAVESIPVFTEGGKDAKLYGPDENLLFSFGTKGGREDETGTRQRSEHRVVRQLGCELGDRLIELLDEFDCGLQLPGKRPGFEGAGVNDGGVVSQCGCGADRLNAGFDKVRATDMVFSEEPFQGAAPGAFDLFEGGPAGNEGTEDERLLVAEPL